VDLQKYRNIFYSITQTTNEQRQFKLCKRRNENVFENSPSFVPKCSLLTLCVFHIVCTTKRMRPLLREATKRVSQIEGWSQCGIWVVRRACTTNQSCFKLRLLKNKLINQSKMGFCLSIVVVLYFFLVMPCSSSLTYFYSDISWSISHTFSKPTDSVPIEKKVL